MFRKIKEKLSVQLSKRPGRIVICVILLLNIAFIFIAAAIVNAMQLSGTEKMGFWRSAYYTVTMILDAGCIDYVISDIGTAKVALVIVCIVIIILGMVLFTGAVIGYLTNYISGFIEGADGGKHKLCLSEHTVILNWNSRANEIINDMLYCEKRQVAVVLVSDGKEDIEKDIEARIAGTLEQERAELKRKAKEIGGIKGFFFLLMHRFGNNVTAIVREGDPFSEKSLRDISIDKASTIIILGGDGTNDSACKLEVNERLAEKPKGNPRIIKSLVLVADITSGKDSTDGQKIVVESEDDWTTSLIQKIIDFKQVDGKCNIVPVGVNHILGRLLAQFSLMPELNLAYRELFSNKGATFYSKPVSDGISESEFVEKYLETHTQSIPLALMKDGNGTSAYYCARSEADDGILSAPCTSDYAVSLNPDYWIERKNVVILGHNSKIKDIMAGFNGFRDEWNYPGGGEIMDIIVIDDKEHLESMDYFKEYPYVKAVVADLYDRDKICDTIEEFVDSRENDTSVLILSDDLVPSDEIDAGALTNLIYVSDIIHRKKLADKSFDENKIDVVVEILDPKHTDIVRSYSVNNVVISNRYISKMITQIGEKDSLFAFYTDILSYDAADSESYESKEVYVKKVSRLFTEVPKPCTASELVRAVYKAGREQKRPLYVIALGYVKSNGQIFLFSGNMEKQQVALEQTDKLIVFADH